MSNRFFPNYDTYKITSRYGMRTLKGMTKMHNGIDLVAKAGNGSITDYVTAHTGGTVVSCGYDKSAGNLIKIQTTPGVIMVYYHLKHKPDFKKGDRVETGQIIGYMGSTGNVTGAHLHFGIQVDGEWIDPEPYLDKNYINATTRKTVNVSVPVLDKGDKTESVRAMQSMLIANGYDCGEKGADGSFGGATLAALRKYQKENGLQIDGICGPATWSSLLGVD